MATLASLVVSLTTETRGFSKGLEKSEQQTRQFLNAAKTNFGNAQQHFAQAGAGLRQAFSGVGQLVSQAGASLAGLANRIPLVSALGRVAGRAGMALREGIGTAVAGIGARIGTALAPARQTLTNFGLGAATLMGRLGQRLAPAIQGIGTVVSGLGKAAGGALAGLGQLGGALGHVAQAGLSAAAVVGKALLPGLQSIGKIALGAAGIVGGALVAGLVAVGPQAINAASDFEESLSKVQVVFGDSAGVVEQFSATTAASMGIAQRDALAAAGTFGNLFRTMGIGQGASAQMSTDLVQLSADLASFNNLDPTDVLEKLRSGLVGETEPLRALGINLTDAAVRAQAVEMGLAKTTKEVDQAAMTQARFALILEQSSLAQGDFARTSDGLANQQRILGATWQDMLQKVGVVALPLVNGALGGFLTLLQGSIIPTIDKVVGAFGDFQWMLSVGVEPLTAFKIILGQFLPPETAAAITDGIGAIVSGVQAFSAWVAPIAATVGAWIAENVSLNDVLIVLGGAIASVVIPAIMSVIAAAAPVIATFVLLVAVVAALRAAWEGDFLGIRTALENAWATILPVIQELWAWLQTNLPLAIQALSDFWNNTLLPAIMAVWSFVQANVIPLMQALGDLLTTVIGVAVTALAGLWETVLLPALKSAGDWISGTFGPILEKFTGWLESVTGGVDGISAAFQTAIGWIKDLAEKLGSLTLPDWMTPGSPTPLEIGLLGIGAATHKLARVELPGLRAEFAGLRDEQAAPTTVSAPVTVNAQVANGIDLEDLAWRISELIGQRVAGYV